LKQYTESNSPAVNKTHHKTLPQSQCSITRGRWPRIWWVTVWTSWSYCHGQALRPFNAFISIIPKSSPWLFSDEVIQW